MPKMAAASGTRRATAFKERPTNDVSHLGGGNPDIDTPSGRFGGAIGAACQQCKVDAARGRCRIRP
jgi:hypothetical protein